MTQIKIYLSKIEQHRISLISEINAIILRLINEFGGLTVYQARGFWLNPKTRQLEIENGEVFEFFTKNTNMEDINAIVKAECKKLKQLLNQNCLLYTINYEPIMV